jgi:site-specific DNA-cytosine methylase
MKEYTALHLFCGIGGAALGFQNARAEYRGMVGGFRTLAGIDCDPEACQDFETLTGAPAVQMDLFSRDQYKSFHGQDPSQEWQEVSPEGLLQASGLEYPDVVFLSPPCKGFSGLLPSEKSKSDKYQALNQLVIRGLQLVIDAYHEDLPAVIMIENVPRITSRGDFLLKQVKHLLGQQSYVFHEGFHDCGELGGLAQHRKRFLMIARLESKMSSFIYRPYKKRVKSIGEVIGPLPMPDDPTMGPMHRLPRLQWKTWVRLSLIPAGGDWRDLENCGQYQIEHIKRGSGSLGVQEWNQPGHTVIGNAKVGGSSATAISDPRLKERDNRHPGVYQVVRFDEPGPCVTGTRFGSGAPAIADPRTGFKDSTHHAIYQVSGWDETANTVTGAARPNNGAISIVDPRVKCNSRPNLMGVADWNKPTSTITGSTSVSSSNAVGAVADPRLICKPRSGMMGVQDWDKPGATVIGAGDIHSGATAVADPRIPKDNEVLDPPPVIIALDGTWHRPLTTLELAVLQSLRPVMSDGRPLQLAGNSDARWRERIGNMVPPEAAEAIGEEMLLSFMASEVKEEWQLSSKEIWVAPEADKGALINVH